MWLKILAATVGGSLALVIVPLLSLVLATRPFCRLVLATRYRFKVRGCEHIPKFGPVLIASNHVTWLDGVFVMAVCPRRPLFLVNAAYIDRPILRSIARRLGLIPVPSSGPRGQRAAISAARAALDRGRPVVIFPEAQLSRNGLTGPFLRGVEAILHNAESVPVVPVFLDNLWGSMLSYSGGRTLWKRPKGLRRLVGVAFGPPIAASASAFQVRQAVVEAGVRAFELRETAPLRLETVDPSLPRLEHPSLGLLAASTLSYDHAGIRQIGFKARTLGQAVPGVALRVVDATGRDLPPDQFGRLLALLPGRADWLDTGLIAALDRDGFVKMESSPS